MTVNHTLVPSTQSNFTVLVSVTDPALKTVAKRWSRSECERIRHRVLRRLRRDYEAQVGSREIRWHNRQPDRMGKNPHPVEYVRHVILSVLWGPIDHDRPI